MQSILLKTGVAAFLCLAASGCVVAEGGEPEDDEDLGTASAAQIDIGYKKKWRLYTATFSNGQPFFRVLAIGGSDVGPYQANTEYWYVTSANLGYLGQNSVVFSHVDGDDTPPKQSGSAQFQTPWLVPWTSFSNDPVSGGYRYDNGSVHLRIAVNGGEISGLTWYQTIPAAQTPTNIALNGTFTVGSGSVVVPQGSVGYYVNSAIP
ncbi:uncharacterized protein SOCEGT47_044140 [Sorangium cellulosum]|uniref:Secreted protein n=1 Tax=Sorangium cellulosum TaxID=56 RepID=A0A4P2Q3I5_SORCE|nr:hypothetical protein [Sorangium cellulosum]AUX23884.1 uncharacterized protein SOCEGT47_044140 [Sorangium cellulosum]